MIPKKTGQMRTYILIISIVFLFLFKGIIRASSSQTINTSIKLSVCGNNIAEYGEDCDNDDLRNYQCLTLGYAGGHLSCDINCSFRVSSCQSPTITANEIAPSELKSLLPAGLMAIPPTASIISTPSITTTQQLTIYTADNIDRKGSVVLPNQLVIAKIDGTDFDPRDLTTSDVLAGDISGLEDGKVAYGALQFGITGTSLEFSQAITIKIFVGATLDGKTLSVVRSSNLSTGWTQEGIVTPSTCVVSGGWCSFQAINASYYAVLDAVTLTATPTSNLATTNTSTTVNSNSSNTSANTSESMTAISRITLNIPAALRYFTNFLNDNGKIKLDDLYNVVKNWVIDWRDASLIKMELSKSRKCDVNQDNICDIRDLSVLLFYIER